MPALALPELIFYALIFLTLALAFTSRKLTQALFGPLISLLQSIPAIGGALAAPFAAIERAIVGACGSIEHGCDSLMGAAWHATARLLDWTWKEIRSHAGAIATIAPLVGTLVGSYRAIRALVHYLRRASHGVTAAVKTLTKEFHGIEHRVKVLERDVAKGIGADVLPRIKTLEREVATVENKVIPAVESAEQALARDITNLGEYVRANFVSTATDAITAAVAIGLAALGLGGLRCKSFGNLLNKWGCGLGSLLDGLLGLVLSALALEEVCRFLPILETAFGEVVGPITHLLTEVPLGGCEQPPKSWAQLNVAAGPLPPQQTLGALPA